MQSFKKVLGFIALLFALLFIVYFARSVRDDNKPTPDNPAYVSEFNPEDIVELEPGINIMKGELLIITDDEESLKKEVEKHKGKIVGEIPSMNTYQVLFEDVSIEELKELKTEFESYDWVKDVTFDYVNEVQESGYQLPNDYPSNEGRYAYEAVDAPAAWELLEEYGYSNLHRPTITVMEPFNLDTNRTYDLLIQDYYPSNNSNNDHGINVTGIIAAERDNYYGIPGMIPDSDIHYYTINEEAYDSQTGSYITRGIDDQKLINDAVLNSPNNTPVVNMSYGMFGMAVGASNNVESMVTLANEYFTYEESYLTELLSEGKDFLLIKCAGNENDELYYLLSNDEILRDDWYEEAGRTDAVMELNGNVFAQWDTFAGIENPEIKNRIIIVGSSYSDGYSTQASTYHANGERIDIIAPGEYISMLTGDLGWGTSFATPFVTGTAGMLLSIDPTLSGPELKEIILSTGTGAYNIDYKSAPVPHLNAYNAVQEVINRTNPVEEFDYDSFKWYVPSTTSLDLTDQGDSSDYCSYLFTWNAVDGADGYEVSVSSWGEHEEIIETTRLQTIVPVHYEYSHLTVKVRAYKIVDGERLYTSWSAPIQKYARDIKEEVETMRY